MRTFPDLRMCTLAEDARRAPQLLDPNEHGEGRNLFAPVAAPSPVC